MALTGQSRLKRRLAGGSFSTSSPKSRPITSDEFDIPLFETHLNSSVKRTKIDDDPQKIKKATKKKSQIVDKQQAKKPKERVKAISSPKNHIIVTKSRPKRAAKTPVYVDDSDGGEHDADGTKSHNDGASDEGGNHQEELDVVHDSYALSKSTVDTALEASKHSFNSNPEEIVCPAPNVAHDNSLDESTVEVQKSDDSTSSKVSLGNSKTPQRKIQSVKEPWMPPVVKEKVLRKTPIVHFGPSGPDNQAVVQKPHCRFSKTSKLRDHSRSIAQVEDEQEDPDEFAQDFNDIGVDAVSDRSPAAELFNDNPKILTFPQPQERISLPHRAHQASVSKPNVQQDATEQNPSKKTGIAVGKAATGGPIRTKRNPGQTISKKPTEVKQPLLPATPVSFLARLKNESVRLQGSEALVDKPEAFADHDMTHTSGDVSITLLNENPDVPQKSLSYRSQNMQRQRSVSTTSSSQEDSPPRGKGLKDTRKEQPVDRLEGIRQNQYEIVDSILLITKDVMFRFGAEEDAIKAKVKAFDSGGRAVLQTLSDSWNDRLAHHHQKVSALLEEERVILAKASETVNGAKAEESVVSGDNTIILRTIDSKANALVSKIAALRC